MTTPQTETPEIAKALGIGRLYAKREDLHPYGSHKGRSIPAMIDMKAAKGARDFVISSSGNAALAAVRHIQKQNAEGASLSLSILIGGKINDDKRRALMSEIGDPRIKIEEAPRPLQSLLGFVKGGKASLRQSNDDDALVGYGSLAEELAAIPNISAVFIGASSGTTAEALAEYFAKKGLSIAVHAVQTSAVNPLATALGAKAPEPEVSIADAIVDKVAHRRNALVAAIRRTGGAGWIASNADISRAQGLLRDKAGIEATANGALGLAGLVRALDSGAQFSGAIAFVITGK